MSTEPPSDPEALRASAAATLPSPISPTTVPPALPLPSNPGRPTSRLSMHDRPRQIQLPPRSRGPPRVQGIATAPILSLPHPHPSPPTRLTDLGSLVSEEDESSPPTVSSAHPQPRIDLRASAGTDQSHDYFSLPQISSTVSTGLELGLGHPTGSTEPKFFRPLMVDPEQLFSLAERTNYRSAVLPSALFSPGTQSRNIPTGKPRPRSADMSNAPIPTRSRGPAVQPMRVEFGYTSAASTPSADPGRSPSSRLRRFAPNAGNRSPVSNARSSIDSLCATPGSWAVGPDEPKPILGSLLAGEEVPTPDCTPHHADGGNAEPNPGPDSSRHKILTSLQTLVQTGPLPSVHGEPVRVVEYGSVEGRAFPLLSALLESLADALDQRAALGTCQDAHNSVQSTLEPSVDPNHETEGTNVIVIHTGPPGTDFRSLMSALETDPLSYLSQDFAGRTPSARMFPYFTTRPFGTCVAPKHSVDLGVSVMDLHWAHSASPEEATSPANSRESFIPAPLGSEKPEGELNHFLLARAQEVKRGGQLIVAYIARDDAVESSISARKEEVWSVLNSLLIPSLQRLVSCGMLKADVARYMLTLPLFPRTSEQSARVLQGQKDLWDIEWACGLGDYGVSSALSTGLSVDPPSCRPQSEPRPICLPHPAWTAYVAGRLSRQAYSEHIIVLIKSLYDAHWRNLLSLRGRMSKGAVAYTLDALYDVLSSRIDDVPADDQLARIEFDVCLYSLRRR